MPYLFATTRHNETDYAGGRVFYGRTGHPAFPVRLVSEIFQRCLALRKAEGLTAPCALYDPCCGGAYHLATLAYLHGETIASITASDIDADALILARRNLDLLTLPGLEQRITELEALLVAYGKSAHAEALESAARLRERLLTLTAQRAIPISVFQADATDAAGLVAVLGERSMDVVITDVPYNRLSTWHSGAADPLEQMLEALRPVLSPGAVVAVASDKGQMPAHAAYRRADRFQIGKRRIVFLKLGLTQTGGTLPQSTRRSLRFSHFSAFLAVSAVKNGDACVNPENVIRD